MEISCSTKNTNKKTICARIWSWRFLVLPKIPIKKLFVLEFGILQRQIVGEIICDTIVCMLLSTYDGDQACQNVNVDAFA